METLICIQKPSEISYYLENGWSIKNISAYAVNGVVRGCWVHLVRKEDDN